MTTCSARETASFVATLSLALIAGCARTAVSVQGDASASLDERAVADAVSMDAVSMDAVASDGAQTPDALPMDARVPLDLTLTEVWLADNFHPRDVGQGETSPPTPDGGVRDVLVSDIQTDIARSDAVSDENVILRPDVPGPSGCSSATVVSIRPVTEGSSSAFDSTEWLPACTSTSPAGGPVRWFTVLPSTDAVEFLVLATSSVEYGNPVVRVYDGCNLAACAIESENPYDMGTVRVRLPPRDVGSWRVAVSSDEEDPLPPPRAFRFDFVARPLSDRPVTHGVCASALRVRDGSELLDESLRDAQEPARACEAAPTPALFYAVTVGAGETLRATAIHGTGVPMTAPTLPALRLSDGCASTTCLSTSTTTAVPGQAQLQWRNATDRAQEVILSVEVATRGDLPFRFDLAIQVGASP